jgi:mRNA-degrading endonuclease RelE of RelBE toxin-antitoxin system
MKPIVTTIPKFDKEAKALAKKYPSLKNDLKDLADLLIDNPECGTLLFDDVYKIRMAIKSKSKGKRGGARVIYFNVFAQRRGKNEIVLLSIYDKSNQENITDKQIRDALKSV